VVLAARGSAPAPSTRDVRDPSGVAVDTSVPVKSLAVEASTINPSRLVKPVFDQPVVMVEI
jgi:hypothetical protein